MIRQCSFGLSMLPYRSYLYDNFERDIRDVTNFYAEFHFVKYILFLFIPSYVSKRED
jgi:hypothetical protein